MIARAVADFNAAEINIPKADKTKKLIDDIRKHKYDEEGYTNFSEAVINFCDSTDVCIRPEELVKSHNDLYFPNISTSISALGPAIVFIDLGHVSYNQAGAEFHHFVRSGIVNKNMKMAENIIKEYAGITGDDISLLTLNAYRFALLRVAGRLRTHIARRNREKFVRELDIGWRLHKSAISILR